jgi:hypothetical protein
MKLDMSKLTTELEELIRAYGTSQIIEELANITLRYSDVLQSNQFFNAEMEMRQQATKLFKITSKDQERIDTK